MELAPKHHEDFTFAKPEALLRGPTFTSIKLGQAKHVDEESLTSMGHFEAEVVVSEIKPVIEVSTSAKPAETKATTSP